MKKIYHIVLTGGPCSGKSTFMKLAHEHFTNQNYVVLIDNESATDLISGGISPASMGMYQFQKYVIGLQLKKEELFEQAAHEIKGDNVIIFYDRAILDDKGYVSHEEFYEILSTFDITEEEVLKQYDLVIHLSSAAKGDFDAYQTENNQARYEDKEEAIEVDNMLIKSWEIHPNRIIIEQSENFDVKMNEALQAVESLLKK